MEYRCEATSIEGFVQQLAVALVGRGYWFYVSGFVPEGKDLAAVDRKLVERYEIDVSKWARSRRKREGKSSMAYIRFERFFLLLATHGKHRFFEEEAKSVRDVRRVPIKFRGYAIGCRDGHPSVRIEREEYKRLKAHLLEFGRHRQREAVEAYVSRIPFEPYAPVRRQLLNILRAVNRERKTAGFELLSYDSIRMKRRIVKPFGAEGDDEL